MLHKYEFQDYFRQQLVLFLYCVRTNTTSSKILKPCQFYGSLISKVIGMAREPLIVKCWCFSTLSVIKYPKQSRFNQIKRETGSCQKCVFAAQFPELKITEYHKLHLAKFNNNRNGASISNCKGEVELNSGY